jgi:hypothetical protein
MGNMEQRHIKRRTIMVMLNVKKGEEDALFLDNTASPPGPAQPRGCLHIQQPHAHRVSV